MMESSKSLRLYSEPQCGYLGLSEAALWAAVAASEKEREMVEMDEWGVPMASLSCHGMAWPIPHRSTYRCEEPLVDICERLWASVGVGAQRC